MSQPGRKLPKFPASSDYLSDVEPDTREMVRAQNKKKKKSGGFQSMGKTSQSYTIWINVVFTYLHTCILLKNIHHLRLSFPSPLTSGLSFPVYKGVMRKGYKIPTPIQRKVNQRNLSTSTISGLLFYKWLFFFSSSDYPSHFGRQRCSRHGKDWQR